MEHIFPIEVTPRLGKGALDTWRFPLSAWVAGLIKPAQSPDAGLETRLGANQERKGRTGTSVLTSAHLGRPTEDSQGFKPDLGDPAVRDYRGASGTVARVEMRSHLAIERARLVTLHLPQARRSSIPTLETAL